MITLAGFQSDMAAMAKARAGHARGHEPPLTAAHTQAAAEMDAACAGEGHCEDGPAAEDASKGTGHLEAEPGPGVFGEPATPPGPQAYDRPYLDEGRAAPSPMHGPPNHSPLPPQGRGILEPLAMSAAPQVVGAGPGADAMAAHAARAMATTPRMPIPRGSA